MRPASIQAHPALDELDGAVVNSSCSLSARRRVCAAASSKFSAAPANSASTPRSSSQASSPTRISAEVLDQAERGAKPVSEPQRAGREDFRHLPIVTIDEKPRAIYDDASTSSIAPTRLALAIHIADVATMFELPPLDQEARLRGTSVYSRSSLSYASEALSNGMCSLKPTKSAW